MQTLVNNSMLGIKTIFKIVLIYLVLGALWIYFSDNIVAYLVKDPASVIRLGIYKGLSLVLLTSFILFILIYRYLRKHAASDAKLVGSEERFRTLFEKSPLAISVLRNFKIEYVNSKLVEMGGFESKEELVGQSIVNGVAAEDVNKFIEGFNYNNYSAENTFEIIALKKDGTKFPVLCTVTKMIFEDGEASVAFFQDITESKSANDRLKKSELRNRLLLDAFPDFIFHLSDEGVFLDYKCENEKDLFLKPDEFIGKRMEEVFPPQISNPATLALKKAFTSGNVQTFEYEVQLQSGTAYFEARVVAKEQNAVFFVRNISDRKKIEKELKESQRSFSTLISNLPGIVYRVKNDEKWTTEYISEGCYDITGFNPDDFYSGKINFWDVTHPEDRENLKNIVNTAVEKKESYKHTYKMISASGKTKWVWEQGQGVFSDNDELEFLEGFITDVSENQHYIFSLSESEEKFRTIIEQFAEGFILINHEGKIIIWNRAAEEISGIQHHVAVNKYYWDVLLQLFIPEHNTTVSYVEIKDKITNAIKNKDINFTNSVELTFQRTDGSVCIVWHVNFPVWVNGEFSIGIIIRDITEQRTKEKIIHDSQQRLSLLIEQSPLAVIEWNLNYEVLEWNPAAVQIFGYARNEAIGKHATDLIVNPQKDEKIKSIWEKMINDKKGIHFTGNNLHKDGSSIICDWYCSPILDADGRIVAIATIAVDNTERIRNQEQLIENEEKFRTFIEQIEEGLILLDKDGKIIIWNKALESITGLKQQDVIDKPCWDILFGLNPVEKRTPEFYEKLKNFTANFLNVKKPYNFSDSQVVTYLKGDGQSVSVRQMLFNVKINDHDCLGGIIEDITERKKFEEQLRIKDFAIKSSLSAVGIADMSGKIIFANEAYIKLWGYGDEKEVLGMNISEFSSKEESVNEFHQEIINELMQGHGYFGEGIATKKNGAKFYLQIIISLVRLPDGQPIAIMSSFMDITERKESERALRESEEMYRTLVTSVPVAIIRTDLDGNILFMNETAIPFNKSISNEGIIGKNILSFIAPYDLNRTLENMSIMLDRPMGFVEYDLQFEDDTILNCEVNGNVLRDDDGNPYELVFVVNNITERKKSEEAIKQSSENFRRIFEQAPFGMLITRASDDVIVEINEAYSEIFGCSRDERIGKISRELFRNDVAEETLKEIADKGYIDNFEYTFHRKDGNEVTVVFSSRLIDFNNKPSVLTVFKDITELKKAEEETRASEQRLNIIAEATFEGIGLIQDEIIIDANEQLADLLKVPRPELIGSFIRDFIDPGSLDYVLEMIRNKNENPYQYNAKNSEGKIFPVEVHARYIELKGTKYRVSVVRDITEQKEHEEQILSLLKRMNNIIELIPDATFIIDQDKKVIYWNRAMEDLTGTKKENILGKSNYEYSVALYGIREPILIDLTDTENKDIEGRYIYFKRENEIVYAESDFVNLSSGKTAYLWGIAAPLYDKSGVRFGSIEVIRDISERRLTEKALQESEERLRSLYQNATIGLYRTTNKGRIILANDRLVKMLGYDSFEELAQRNVNETGYVNPEIREVFRKILEEKGEVSRFEAEWYRKDGSHILIQEGSKAVRNEKGEIEFYDGTVVDITEKRKTELELERYRRNLEELIKERTKELEEVNLLLQEEIIKQKESEEKVKKALIKEKELNELKSKFISVASHEFRTPLATMYSSTEILEVLATKWDQKKFNMQIERIRKNIRGLTEIMDDVLVISRAESGKIKFEPVESDIRIFIENIIEDAKTLLTSKHNLKWKLDIREKTILIDEKLLKMAIMNLLSNAVKYSPTGGEIEFTVVEKYKNLCIRITDKGIGIPDKYREHIYEPFNRASNVGHIQGTGLGLSIVKKYVEIHKGTIDFLSILGEGTTFIINIPVL